MFLVAVGTLFSGFIAVSPVGASRPQVVVRARFVGQVTALQPGDGSPTGFVLLQPNSVVTIGITAQTQFVSGSAEANVEGLTRDDYAVVTARRGGGRWIATRISYDVDPILPLLQVSGVVTNVSVNGRRVDVHLDTGPVRAITIGRDARWTLDGRTADSSISLFKGESVGFIVNRSTLPWLALEVDARSGL
jgi:hypothetical protein